MSLAQPGAPTPPVVLASSKDIVKEDVHKYRRRFIGPILATALHQAERPKKQKRRHRFFASQPESSSSDSDSDSSSLSDVIHRHALEFFLKHGGKRENWGGSQQKSVRVEMRRRWRESEWGRVHKARRQGTAAPKWVGNSFDVGVFLGVDVLDEDLPGDPTPEAPLDGLSTTVQPHPPISVVARSIEAETFVTAVSYPQSTFPPPSSLGPPRGVDALSPHSTNSSTALLAGTCSATPQVSALDKPMEGPGPSSVPEVAFLERHINGTPDIPDPEATPKPNKGKDKEVRFKPETPAPPREVLARKGSAVKTTSAGAVEQKTSEASVEWGDVIMRGMTAPDVFLKGVIIMFTGRPYARPSVIYGRHSPSYIR